MELYQNGGVLPLYMSMNYISEGFQKTLAEGLTEMAEKDGPYLVQCTEGKDRTGFVCILLEALCGASPEELEEDYMLTYDNYYGINKESDPNRYDTIKEMNFDAMLDTIISDRDADFSKCAKDYMLSIGMSEETIDKLKALLSN